jgi:hypothetical protein
MQQKYPSIGNNIYGHGELNPGHKQSDEGMQAVQPYRAVSGKPGTPVNTDAVTKALTNPTPTQAPAAQANAQPATPKERPALTEINLPGKGKFSLEDGVLSPTTTGQTSQKLPSAGDLVSKNPTIPGQQAGFGQNQAPDANGFSGKSGQIQQSQGVLGQLSGGHLGGILGQLSSGQLGGLAGKLGNMLVSPAAAADGVKPLASAGALASGQPIGGGSAGGETNSPSTQMITMPDGSQQPFTSSAGPMSGLPQGASIPTPAAPTPTAAPAPTPSPVSASPISAPLPGQPSAGSPAMTMPSGTTGPTTGSSASTPAAGQPLSSNQAMDMLFGTSPQSSTAPSSTTPATGAGQRMSSNQAMDMLFGASPQSSGSTGVGQPLTSAQAINTLTGGDAQPLMISGIKPSSAASNANPLVPNSQAQAPQVPATQPTSMFQPRTDAPDAQSAPSQSQGTIWGANWHGPGSGLFDGLAGNQPQAQSGFTGFQPQSGQSGQIDPLTGQNLAQPPQGQSQGFGQGQGQGLGQFDPLTGQALNSATAASGQFDPLTGQLLGGAQNNSGSGFMSFLGGLFG